MNEPTCQAKVEVGPGEWRYCRAPAPTHGVTLSGTTETGEAVVPERRPLCDEHYAALLEAQRAGLTPPSRPTADPLGQLGDPDA